MKTMQKKKTSACLKQYARGAMTGKYRNAISLLLASDLIITTLSLFTTTTTHSYMGIAIGFIISFILSLLGTVLEVGQCSFYLNIACKQEFQFSDLFTGFKTHPDKILFSQIIIRLLTALPLIPAFIVSIIGIFNNQASYILAACVLLIAGCIVSCWISLVYSQVYYVLLDFPECSTKELLQISRRLMKGNKGRLLYLQLSFLPMSLVSLISFGIGFLFVHPYQNMTYTFFYLDLMEQA